MHEIDALLAPCIDKLCSHGLDNCHHILSFAMVKVTLASIDLCDIHVLGTFLHNRLSLTQGSLGP